MGKLQWYINRLRAMNVREVVWRLDQKRIEKQEQKRFAGSRINVGTEAFNPEFKDLEFNAEALGINFANTSYNTFTEIHLLKGLDNDKWPDTFSYSLNYKQRDDLGDARTNWEKNRHFDWALLAKAYYVTKDETYFTELQNTADDWMEKNPFLHGISWTSAMEFAIRSINWMYALAFLEKTREVNCRLSDIKTKTIKTPDGSVSNCESEIVSKLTSSASQSSTDSFAAPIQPSGKKQEKPFVADERLDEVCGKLRNGIINITEYLTKHYSRFSSANNHLLVEATAIGLAGYAFGHKPWQELAVKILTEELPKQNYSDGVNKELSLHYQTFGMEAYLLLMHAAQANDNTSTSSAQAHNDNCSAGGYKTKTIKTPEGSVSNEESEIESKLSSSAASSSTSSNTASSNPSGKKQEINLSWKSWMPMLQKEAEYVAHSTWREKAVCEFGDDDEGKILDLQGGEWHQWEWVLQLASLVTGVRYSNFEEICENTLWFFSEEQIEYIKKASLYDTSKSRCFEIGGNSFLRDKEDRVLIGIDHAELGFGSIAAHGHADALSFQMLIDGVPVLVDPGTYIYHCDLEHRNSFRKTINHNTLCIDGKDQSQMLGAFLWGERANCKLINYSIADDRDILIAEHDGYRPCVHTRSFEFDKENMELSIGDKLSIGRNWTSTLMLGIGINASVQDNTALVEFPTGSLKMEISGHDRIELEDAEVSMEYGMKVPSKAIRIYGNGLETNLKIKIELK